MKHGGVDALFLTDGYDFLAAKVQTVAHKISSLTEQSDGLGDPSQANTPVGKQQATLTQGGAFFDTAALNIHDAMATKLGATPNDTPRVTCLGIMGNTVGAQCYGLAGVFSVAYESVLTLSKLTKANAEHLLQGLVERGQVICALASRSATFDTTATPVDYTTDPSQVVIPITSNSIANPTVVTTAVPHGLTTGQKVLISGVATSNPTINGEQTVTVIDTTHFSVVVNVTTGGTGGSFVRSSSVNGASGYQQVTAFAGFTGYVGKLRHSADNITYADLITFTNVTTGPKAERVTAAGTVNRYVVYTGTVTGTGSISPFAMIARS
jgi:hypothetical protein